VQESDILHCKKLFINMLYMILQLYMILSYTILFFGFWSLKWKKIIQLCILILTKYINFKYIGYTNTS